jgi:hypothetical protein
MATENTQANARRTPAEARMLPSIEAAPNPYCVYCGGDRVHLIDRTSAYCPTCGRSMYFPTEPMDRLPRAGN